MCSFSTKQNPYDSLVSALPRPCPSKRTHKKDRLRMLKRRRAQLKETRQRKRKIVVKAEIEMKNLELYMENKKLIEKNEKLMKQAMLLHKENQALLCKLQKKLAEQNNSIPITSYYQI
ncbi:unnamed protein product [Lupinus luteus]|uniref:Uncharacterized protein n=1 Tax=Lupinus luteus TaxID=3873 RepID=A0AAV1W5T6_LUPLU